MIQKEWYENLESGKALMKMLDRSKKLCSIAMAIFQSATRASDEQLSKILETSKKHDHIDIVSSVQNINTGRQFILWVRSIYCSEAYSEHCQTCAMEH